MLIFVFIYLLDVWIQFVTWNGRRSEALRVGSGALHQVVERQRAPLPLRRASPRQGLLDIARHVIGCRLTQQARVQNASGDEAGNVPGRYCSPRHRMPFDSRNEVSECV